ncbi:alkaline ceramidase ydc1 [Collariella sp. IMI 366227]|nr:alkaline ceramidase ydc1 [Collariella sp. IMI 366227]
MGHHNLHFYGDPSLVYLALRAMYSLPNGRLRPLLSPAYDFMSLSLLVLGIGSFLFHATLRQAFEFADEFSMMGLVWSMLQALLTLRQPPARARVISVGLTLVFAAFLAFYLWSAQIIYQVIAFLTALGGVVVRSVWLFHFAKPGLPEERAKVWRRQSWIAVGVSVVAYVLWNIDLEFCAELRRLKAQVGLPWAWVLELHGWWHVLTAVGAGIFMQVTREVREVEEAERVKAGKRE